MSRPDGRPSFADPFEDVAQSPERGLMAPFGARATEEEGEDVYQALTESLDNEMTGSGHIERGAVGPVPQHDSSGVGQGDPPIGASDERGTEGAARDEEVEEVSATQPGSRYAASRELRKAHSPSGDDDRGPDRLHVMYHVNLGYDAGSYTWATKTVAVTAQPIQLLPRDPNRRRALIVVNAASADGAFIAIGTENLSAFSWSPALGLQPNSNAYLMSTATPGTETLELKHIREVWACFVPDLSKGQTITTAIVSVLVEQIDARLADSVPAQQPTSVDR